MSTYASTILFLIIALYIYFVEYDINRDVDFMNDLSPAESEIVE